MDGEESKLGGANKKHRRFEECLFTNLLSVERSCRLRILSANMRQAAGAPTFYLWLRLSIFALLAFMIFMASG
jgi:hypothetical protein